MTILPMIIGFIIAKNVLKLPLLNNFTVSITGGMTSTPALGTLDQYGGNKRILRLHMQQHIRLH